MFKENKILNYRQEEFSFEDFESELKSLQGQGYNVFIGSDSQVI